VRRADDHGLVGDPDRAGRHGYADDVAHEAFECCAVFGEQGDCALIRKGVYGSCVSAHEVQWARKEADSGGMSG
jgi:hypothetical protein